MNALIEQMLTLAPHVAELWVTSVWQGMALAFAAGLLLRLVPRANASTRFAVWLAGFISIGILPFLPLLSREVTASSSAPTADVMASTALVQFNSWWSAGIVSLLASVVLFQTLRLALDLWGIRQAYKSSYRLSEDEIPGELYGLLSSTGRRSIQLRLTEEVDTPSAIGFFSPAVVIPSWLWSDLPQTQLKQILLHELAHLRRYDDWLNLFQRILQVLLPLNPALFWLHKQLCREREMACDDAVLAASVQPVDYASCLTEMAARKMSQRSAALAPGALAGRSELSVRVHELLNRKRNASVTVARGVALASALIFVAAFVSFTKCPQWISFASPVQVERPEARLASLPQAPLFASQNVSRNVSENHSAGRKQSGSSEQTQTPTLHINELPVPQSVVPVKEIPQEEHVFVVLSVWESDSHVQVQQTALVLKKSASDIPAMQFPQGWFLLQI